MQKAAFDIRRLVLACTGIMLVMCVLSWPSAVLSNNIISPIVNSPATTTITLSQQGLSPADVTIHPADTIVWMNMSGFTATLILVPPNGAQINLPLMVKSPGSGVPVNAAGTTAILNHAETITYELGVNETFSYVFLATGQYHFQVGGFEGTIHVVPPSLEPTATSETTAPDENVLVAAGSVWRYLATGIDAGTSWKEPSYDDASWQAGPAPLGYGDPMSTTINGGPAGQRFITTYLRASFNVNHLAGMQSVTLLLRRDDGAVVYMNGVEVVRSNMPAGAIDYLTLASSTVDHVNETVFFDYVVPDSLLVAGTNTLAVEIHQRSATSSDIGFDLSLEAGASPATTVTPTSIASPAPTATATDISVVEPVIMAAGDIANCSGGLAGARATANLIQQSPNAQVLALGDLAYSSGTQAQFQTCYHPTWGAFANRTRPAPGNHEYRTAGAAGYFGYFNVPEYYSWDFGGWHFISLNSEIDHTTNSSQMVWLRNDLAGNKSRCKLAYWHRPRFSSGSKHGADASFTEMWGVLQADGVSIVLNGHEHHYERFDAQDMNGKADAAGIREFVVGTGGVGFYGFASTAAPNSQFQLTNVFGVLRIDLQPTSYQWQFLDVNGVVRDSGSASCNSAR